MDEADVSAALSQESVSEWASAFWTELVDPLTQEKCFLCPATGEAAWAAPAGALLLPSGKGQFWELVDAVTGTPYYYSPDTRRTTWHRPSAGLVIPLQAVQQSSALGKRLSLLAVQGSSVPSLVRDDDLEEADEDSRFIETPQDSPVSLRKQPTIRIDDVPIASTSKLRSGGEQNDSADLPPAIATLAVPRRPVRQRAATEPPPDDFGKLSLSRPVEAEKRSADLSTFTFTDRRQGLFRRRVPLEEVLKYSAAKLDKPLLELAKPLRSLAVQAFEHVLAITTNATMTDACIWTRATVEQARELTTLALTHTGLQDEIYLQALKQLNGCPTRPNVLRGWALMQCLLSVYPPSPDLQAYLAEFFASAERVPMDRIDMIARFCRRQLALIADRGARTRIPLPMSEIEAASKSAFLSRLFGESIKVIRRRERLDDKQTTVPAILTFLCDRLESAGAKQSEGIFRVNGDVNTLVELRVRLDCGLYDLHLIDGQEADAYTVASLLKLWLRESREALIPPSSYQACVTSVTIDECVEAIRDLPSAHRHALVCLIKHLQTYLAPSVEAVTKMSCSALAMTFVPCLFKSTPTSLALAKESARLEQRFLERLLLTAPTLLDAALHSRRSNRPGNRRSTSVPALAELAGNAPTRRRLASMPAIASKLINADNHERLPYREV